MRFVAVGTHGVFAGSLALMKFGMIKGKLAMAANLEGSSISKLNIGALEEQFDLQAASQEAALQDRVAGTARAPFRESILKPFKRQILALRKANMSFAQIADWLSKNGCQISSVSVGYFVRQQPNFAPTVNKKKTRNSVRASVQVVAPDDVIVPSSGLGKVLFEKYGSAMTLNQLADTLHRPHESLRICLTQAPRTPFNAALIATRFKVGRWVRFRTVDVATLISEQTELCSPVGGDEAEALQGGHIGEVLLAKYGPVMTLQQLADTLHRSPAGLRTCLKEYPDAPFNNALNTARIKTDRAIRFRTSETAAIIEACAPEQ